MTASDVGGIAKLPKPDRRMLEIAEKIIEQQEGKFDPSTFKDRYEDAVRHLIAREKRGQKVTTAPPVEKDDGKVINLMEALQRSLAGSGSGSRTRRAFAQSQEGQGHRQSQAQNEDERRIGCVSHSNGDNCMKALVYNEPRNVRVKNVKDATVVGVFDERHEADRAIDDLVKAGVRNDQIGVVTRDAQGKTVVKKRGEAESHAGSGAVVGAAAGAGIGGLVGLGVLVGVIPVIGPAIAAGTLSDDPHECRWRSGYCRSQRCTDRLGYARRTCQIVRRPTSGRAGRGHSSNDSNSNESGWSGRTIYTAVRTTNKCKSTHFETEGACHESRNRSPS